MKLARHFSDRMEKLFGEPRRPHTEITQRDMDLAFALQHRFEEIFFHLLNQLHERSPARKILRWQADARSTAWPTASSLIALRSAALTFSLLPGTKGWRSELRCTHITRCSNSLGVTN